ncbi:hypothetical protein BDZ97DRAFT_1875190 [Flammula alnicola]|nr:hypothetical protein BDZ97DRAFT_1875190 [Flammula alnicola]
MLSIPPGVSISNSASFRESVIMPSLNFKDRNAEITTVQFTTTTSQSRTSQSTPLVTTLGLAQIIPPSSVASGVVVMLSSATTAISDPEGTADGISQRMPQASSVVSISTTPPLQQTGGASITPIQPPFSGPGPVSRPGPVSIFPMTSSVLPGIGVSAQNSRSSITITGTTGGRADNTASSTSTGQAVTSGKSTSTRVLPIALTTAVVALYFLAALLLFLLHCRRRRRRNGVTKRGGIGLWGTRALARRQSGLPIMDERSRFSFGTV